jgi:hypothetical protein
MASVKALPHFAGPGTQNLPREAYLSGTPQRRRGSATPQMDFLRSHQNSESRLPMNSWTTMRNFSIHFLNSGIFNETWECRDYAKGGDWAGHGEKKEIVLIVHPIIRRRAPVIRQCAVPAGPFRCASEHQQAACGNPDKLL